MSLNTVRFWINAFLPNSVCEQDGDLFAVSIPDPWPRFFAGDQREFDSDVTASARMHSEVTLGDLSSENPVVMEETHRCGESFELDDDGNIINRATAPTDGMHFFNLRGSQTVDPEGGVLDGVPDSVQIDFAGSASLPIPLTFAPDIDYSGTLAIDRAEGN